MSKVLVTNPPGKYILGAGDRWPTIRAEHDPTPIRSSPYPFLIGYTVAVLEKEGYNVAVKDCAEEDWERERFLDYLEEFQDFTVEAWLAFGAYPWNWCPIVTQSNPKDKGFSFLAGPRGAGAA